MSKWLLFSLSLLIATFFLKGCTTKSIKKEIEASGKLNEIVNSYFESYLAIDTLFASSIGDHRFDNTLPIMISKEVRKQVLDLVQKSLHDVKTIDCERLVGQDALTCAMFKADLAATENLLLVDLSYLMPFNQCSSFFADFAELASGASFITFNTEADYENFMKRIEVIPSYFDVMIENMKEGMRKEITVPKVLVGEALKQLDSLLVEDYKASVFYKPLLDVEQKIKGDKAKALISEYSSKIQTCIYPAYKKLQTFIEKEYLPAARTSSGLAEIPGGKEYYLALVKYHTTTDFSPDEIMEIGYGEVARIEKEMEEAKKQLNFSGSLTEFYSSLREHTQKLYPFHSDLEVLSAYEAIDHKVLEKIPDYFRLMPKASLEIREVEKFKAANASEAYQNPSMDGSRPGIFWVPIPDPTKYPVKIMECIFLHEAIPGHHFQISIQQELSLPPYRRFSMNTAYVEGWALYAESLGKDLGMYQDIYQWIGRLTMEMHRAVRLVVDTGIHWKGWTREDAIAYSVEKEPADLADIKREVERYMAIPGQALSYKIGEINIQRLKKLSKEKLRNLYSDKDFHDEILQDGALPLSVLNEKIEKWIQKKQ